MRAWLALVVLYAALTPSCVRVPGRSKPQTSRVTLDSAWGVVLPDSAAAAMLEDAAPLDPDEPWRRLWTPDRTDLDLLEAQLPVVLSEALDRVILEDGAVRPSADAYYRQYAGFFDAQGRRCIYVRGVHRVVADRFESMFAEARTRSPALAARSAPGPRWRSSYFAITHGGMFIFSTVYDVEQERFYPVEFRLGGSGPVQMRTP